jgi:hypothetical protein
VESPEVTIPPGGNSYASDPTSLRANCPGGYVVVGTGVDAGIGNMDFVLDYNTLVGAFVNNDTSINIQAKVQAICAQRPASASVSSNDRVRNVQQFHRDAEAWAKRLERK